VPGDKHPPDRLVLAAAHDDTRSLYHEGLSAAGFLVTVAADGREALAQALATAPSVLVTEARLPFIDGATLCTILRQETRTASIPLLVLTAETREEELHRLRNAGASAVLVKPVSLHAILDEVRRLVATTARQKVGDARAAGDGPNVREPAAGDSSAKQARPASHTMGRGLTSTPPASVPQLLCPTCDLPLAYQKSYVGGVNEKRAEQWDYFACAKCGVFQYRHRSRRLRRVSPSEWEALSRNLAP
jgi:CheY-like chemotaxis protein